MRLAGCIKWSGFLLGKLWISGNCSFGTLGSEVLVALLEVMEDPVFACD